MSRWDFRRELQKIHAALYHEEELTQDEHFELLRLIAGKDLEKAVALLHKTMERKAGVIKLKSRLTTLQIKEASKLLKGETEDDTIQ